MKTASQHVKTLIVATAAVMALAALAFNGVTWFKLSHSIAALHRSMEIKMDLERLLSLLKDVEVGRSGFLLNDDQRYLARLDEVKLELPACIERLRASSVAPGQLNQTEIEKLRRMATEQVEIAVNSIQIRQREGSNAGIAFVTASKKTDLMEELQQFAGTLIARQEHTISARTAVMQADLRWGYASALGTGIVALLSGVIAMLLLRQSAVQARREDRLAMEKSRAQQADRHKSSFLATMSHEIRTPLSAILGFGELLEEKVQTDVEKSYTKTILAAARSLLQLINDILDLSKLEAGMVDLKREPADVRELARFIQQLFKQQAATQGIALRIEIEEAVPPSLLLDTAHLRQILVNMVGNALKFTQHGYVLLRLALKGPPSGTRVCLEITVQDTGQGISEAQQTEIFKPFVQGSNGDDAVQRGTGLGLTIVKRLTELLGGTIRVTSKVGEGSIFVLELPAVEMSTRLASQLHDGHEHVDLNALRPVTLLVVDDNETNRDLVAAIFAGTHHQLRFASDGREAVQTVFACHPHVVLMDIRMPVMGGRDALQAIRAHPDFRLLPIIAVTASSLTDDERELRRSFDGYVRKPFTRAALYHELALFVPRNDAPEPFRPAAAAEVVALTPELVAQWRKLVTRLRQLEQDVWPRLCEGMNMSQITSFAAGLKSDAHEFQCPSLAYYASNLIADSEAFAVISLENRLAEYPELIRALEIQLPALS